MAEPLVPQSPEWWLNKLYGELMSRRVEMERMDAYYTGAHPLPFLTRAHDAKMHDEFRMLLEDSRSNFMRLVVDVVEERMRVEGFRLSAKSDAAADQKSWDIWQANHLDADSQSLFVESFVKKVAYLSVWAAGPGEDHPVIAIEDPCQTIVGYVPGSNFRKRAAALKVWTDDWTGRLRANVYLPDGIYKFEAAKESAETSGLPSSTTGDESQFGATTPGGARLVDAKDIPGMGWRENEAAFVSNPLDVVPIVPVRNRPRILLEGESELTDVYRIQNQINGFLFLLALAGYFGAHRQRWAKGITIMEKDGRPVEPFRTAIDTLWATENPNAEFGEFGQTALDGYIRAIEQKVLHIAVTTRTPRHYLIEQGQSPSGDAIESAEAGLTHKVMRKQRTIGEGLEEAMRLARRFAGEKGDEVGSEVVWADPSTPTDAQRTDAAIKRYQANLVPWAQTMEDLGYSQTQIARMAELRAEEPTPVVEPVVPAA